MRKILSVLGALALATGIGLGATAASATDPLPDNCVEVPPTYKTVPNPDYQEPWTETIPAQGTPTIEVVDQPAWTETITVKEAHWQRYSWTGKKRGKNDPPPFPHRDWQANVQGDPHGVGEAGAYFRSKGKSGKGDWFYLEWVDAVTKTIDHPATYKTVPNPDYVPETTVDHPAVGEPTIEVVDQPGYVECEDEEFVIAPEATISAFCDGVPVTTDVTAFYVLVSNEDSTTEGGFEIVVDGAAVWTGTLGAGASHEQYLYLNHGEDAHVIVNGFDVVLLDTTVTGTCRPADTPPVVEEPPVEEPPAEEPPAEEPPADDDEPIVTDDPAEVHEREFREANPGAVYSPVENG